MLIRVLAQGDHAVGDGVAGGLVAGDREQQEEQVELQLGEALALDLRAEEHGDEVVLGVELALGRQLVEVAVQLHRRVLGQLGVGVVLGVLGADHAVAPVEDQMALILGYAEEIGDHLERELGRDVGDEVALALLADVVDDLGRHLADALLEAADHAGREALVDEQPVAGVHRRVHVEHHQPLLLERLRRLVDQQRRALVGRERLDVAVDVDDVGIAGDGPEPLAVGLVLPVDGRLAAERSVGGVGVLPDERIEWIVGHGPLLRRCGASVGRGRRSAAESIATSPRNTSAARAIRSRRGSAASP